MASDVSRRNYSRLQNFVQFASSCRVIESQVVLATFRDDSLPLLRKGRMAQCAHLIFTLLNKSMR